MADVQGIAELQSAIDEINRQLEESLPDIVMDGAAIIEQEIRARAPKDTGRLIASLDAEADWRKQAASATVEIDRSGPDGTEHYAIFQEYGTSTMPAHPFFRPGTEAAKPKVDALLVSKILGVIEK